LDRFVDFLSVDRNVARCFNADHHEPLGAASTNLDDFDEDVIANPNDLTFSPAKNPFYALPPVIEPIHCFPVFPLGHDLLQPCLSLRIRRPIQNPFRYFHHFRRRSWPKLHTIRKRLRRSQVVLVCQMVVPAASVEEDWIAAVEIREGVVLTHDAVGSK
jgi:hypothetical protein